MDSKKISRFFSFTAIFLLSFVLCIFVTATYIANKSRLEYVQMENLAYEKTAKIDNVISKLLYKTQSLSALVIQNNGEISDFERVAATIIDDPAIRNVILAPNGVVSHVYPLEGNEKVIGLDYFSEGAGNKEAIQARDSEQLVLGGPFDLVQGGQALVGRLPVWLDNGSEKNFWGLVSVTLNYPQALDGAELHQLQNQGFAYEIWRISPDTGERQIISSSNYRYNKDTSYVEQPVTLFNAEWYFRLSPVRKWFEHPETWIYTLSGAIISFLIAILILHNQDLRKMQRNLEELIQRDQLTGTLNRRGMFQSLEKLLSKKEPFILCYMDLNDFKNINDTQGHAMGDRILQQFSKAFHEHLREGDFFGRIGGDEFILVFSGTGDREKAAEFFQRINEYLSAPSVMEHTNNQKITFSVGEAVYPVDGDTIDDIVSVADKAMYQVKMSRK